MSRRMRRGGRCRNRGRDRDDQRLGLHGVGAAPEQRMHVAHQRCHMTQQLNRGAHVVAGVERRVTLGRATECLLRAIGDRGEEMTKQLAVEYPKELRVNCIAPGTVQSPFVEGYLQKYHAHEIEKMRVELAARQPVGRLGTPEEIAATVHYICSPEADFMTGSVVTIDGGWTAV